MFLLFHQGALGDFVLTFPILRALAPQPTRVIAAHSKAHLAASLFPHVTPVSIDQRDWSVLHAECGAEKVSDEGRAMLAAADTIISFISDGNDAWAANLRAIVSPDCNVCFVEPRPSAHWHKHVCDWHSHQLVQQGLTLPTDPGVSRGGDALGPVVIHPGSGGPAKCWSIDRFESLLHRLRDEGISTAIDLGDVEMATWPSDRVKRWRNEFGATTLGSLDAMVDLLKGARLFIGNDSGPTHLAAQMGISTIALFGPSNAAHWAPRGPCVKVLRPDVLQAMSWLNVEKVWHALSTEI
ncbi:MAG: glycosyltransferase family 9 protein [Phycisphaeraceae bacterium]